MRPRIFYPEQESLMTRKITLLIILTLCIATTTEAQDQTQLLRTGHWDLGVQGRYVGSQDSAGDGGSSISLEDNLGWGLAIHYNFNQQFSLGMDFSLHSIDYTAHLVDAEDPSLTGDYTNKLDVAKFGVVGTWNILKGGSTPYINGAISWTNIDTNIDAGMEDGCYWDPYMGQICGPYPTTYETDTASYSFGVGGRLEFGKSFFAKAGYEYSNLNVDAFDGQHLLRIDLGFLH